MPSKKAPKAHRGRPKGTKRGRKPSLCITFDKDVIEWLDALPGYRSTNVNSILRAAKELSDKVNVTKD